MTAKKNEKHKAVAITEKIIKWIFYFQLAYISLGIPSILQGTGEWGIALYVIPPFSALIGLLSLTIIRNLHKIGNVARVAIALNWVVIILVCLYFIKTGHI